MISTVRLGEITEFINGGPWNENEYVETGIPVVRVSDFTENTVSLAKCKFLPRESWNKYSKHRLLAGDLVVATVGSHPTQPGSVVGRPVIIPQSAEGTLLNQNAVCIRPKGGSIDKTYLGYLGCTRIFRDYIVAHARGAANQARMSIALLKEMSVPLPPLPVQRKIAAILSTYDDLIENNTRRIKILEEMAQAIYCEWFVHFRFPGQTKVKMVDSSLGKIPEGWEVSRLSKLIKTQYGYTESAVDSPVGPHFVRGMDINKQTFIDWASVPYCSISEEKHEEYRLRLGDVIVIRMADPGKVGIVERDIDAVFASYLIRLRITSSKLSPYFLFYFLLSDRYQGYVNGASTGTTRKSASAGVLTDIDCVIPPLSLRERFEDEITLLRHMLNNLLEQNINLRQTGDLLLPKLISGEVDVSELDINGREMNS